MLGGSSGLNYMAYVRAPGRLRRVGRRGRGRLVQRGGAAYFRKAEGFVDSPELHADPDAHGHNGPVGVSVRQPILRASNQFVEAAGAAGMKQGDYNGRDRLSPEGVASLFQTTTKDGRRTSTFHAYLEPAMDRENLTVVTGALVERVLLEADGDEVRATGVAYRTEDGTRRRWPRAPRWWSARAPSGHRTCCSSPGSGHETSSPPSGWTASSTSRTSGVTSRTTCTRP